ncbi:hypothetical protein BC936DRAFT_139162 [Jimgerdemannia flammicorona]|uniref:Uncharacterized protein n=1 Tax=Jimgerdemannia flammicorona TaxID=994334 RepID=A0A433BAH7_9FUNG|nr:hypothetical protein BC936DRAFT_139162 [Jimgerdemannia flammicorona]
MCSQHTSQYQCLLRMLQLRHELILSMYPASGLLEFDELGDENFINALVSAFMDGNRWHRSTKVDKMVEILRYTRIHHPDDKTIVFSQWIMLVRAHHCIFACSRKWISQTDTILLARHLRKNPDGRRV